MKIILLIAFLTITNCQAEPNPKIQTNTNKQLNPNEFISSLTLPENLELCGERIPLEIPEVRQRAEREFYMLLQQPGQIILYIKRAGEYFPMYERIIKENDLPDDLKYLSVAESALYQSRSSKGAVGLWQFMEGTARTMGLQVDNFVDERRNPEKSTHAAMKYLKQSFSSKRNWILTFASYNMGNAGVGNALAYQDSDSYFDLYLNEETSRFIFRIAIIKELMMNAEKYGFVIPKWEQYTSPKVKTVRISSSIGNLSEWAKYQGCTYKDVKLLNPWIIDRSLPAPPKGESWNILLPE